MGLIVRTIGPARAKVNIGLANLAYNLRRMVWLAGTAIGGVRPPAIPATGPPAQSALTPKAENRALGGVQTVTQ